MNSTLKPSLLHQPTFINEPYKLYKCKPINSIKPNHHIRKLSSLFFPITILSGVLTNWGLEFQRSTFHVDFSVVACLGPVERTRFPSSPVRIRSKYMFAGTNDRLAPTEALYKTLCVIFSYFYVFSLGAFLSGLLSLGDSSTPAEHTTRLLCAESERFKAEKWIISKKNGV